MSTLQKHNLARTTDASVASPIGDQELLSPGGSGGAAAASAEQLSLRERARRLGCRWNASLQDRKPAAEFVQRVPIGYARRHALLGLATNKDNAGESVLPIAVAEPEHVWPCLDVLGRWLERVIEPVLAERAQILAAINAAYQQQTGQADQVIGQLDRTEVLGDVEAAALVGHEDLLDSGGRAPVIRLVNLILFEAVQQQASDVHLQPYEDKLVVRYRIDGVLFAAHHLPRAMQEELTSRLKVMGKMDIAEKRLAQDGRATVQVGERTIDLRFSSVPATHGERMVIRLLDKSAQLYTLKETGMPPTTLASFRELIGLEHGLVLVTGPTGSGKSTTLYGALQQLNTAALNVITLEDPVEYQLPDISQIQVAAKKGMSFASGLRSVLRQDPDVIMVGEIRDHETAVLAIQSALTGHLVFSTLHTNDAASAVTRLLDLGVEPYLVASSVVGVLAQRLVRRVCGNCGERLDDAEAARELARLGKDGASDGQATPRRGIGCEACRNTGYRGRVGLFELLKVDEAVQGQIQNRGTSGAIKQAAAAQGMTTLAADGRGKVAAGATTAEEVLRVTMQ